MKDFQFLIFRIPHQWQVHPCHDIVTLIIRGGIQFLQGTFNVAKIQIGVTIAAEFQLHRCLTSRAGKNGYWNHPIRLVQLGNIQAILDQPADREATGLGFFFDHKQQGFTFPVRPLQQNGCIQLPKAVPQLVF